MHKKYTVLPTLDGMIRIVSEHPILKKSNFSLLEKQSNKPDNLKPLITSNNSLPQKKLPVPRPFMPTEFILPSILLFRKENNSETMD